MYRRLHKREENRGGRCREVVRVKISASEVARRLANLRRNMVTRVLQTVLEPPHGNALQACAASILGKALDGVPNFVEADDYWQAMLDHASSIGLSVIKVPLTDGKLPFPSASGTFCIARGTSPRGAHGHVIVAAVAADGVSL